MKKAISLCMALAMLLTLFAGCTKTETETTAAQTTGSEAETESTGGEVVEGGSLVRAMPTDVMSLNLIYETGDEGMTMLKPVYDPLYVLSPEGTRYYLAESHTVSEDGLTYTVKLRENLKWHDGEPITADDVIFNFDFRMNPDNSSTSAVKVNGEFVTYQKIDDYTFSVTLPGLSANYEETLGKLTIIPKHIYEGEENIKSSEKNNLGIGSGPFKVEEWRKGESLTLTRFEDYYREPATLESVVFKIIPNESSQEIAFQNGEVNLFRISSQDKYDKYANDDKYEIYSIPEGRINYMGFNSNSANMQDINARKAIALALNVDEIIEGAYGSTTISEAAKTVFCEQNLYYSDVEGYEHNLEEAKKLAQESGLAGKTLKLVYNSSRVNMEDCALIIQQQLKNIDVNVEIQGYETQGFFEVFFYTTAGDWDLGLNGYSTNGDNQGDRYMFSQDGFLCDNVFASQEIEDRREQGNTALDPEKRAEIYKTLQEKIRDIYMMYPISSPNFIMAVEKGYTGLDEIEKVPVFEDYTLIHKVN